MTGSIKRGIGGSRGPKGDRGLITMRLKYKGLSFYADLASGSDILSEGSEITEEDLLFIRTVSPEDYVSIRSGWKRSYLDRLAEEAFDEHS